VRTLVVNAGSSSLKLSLVRDASETLVERELSAPRGQIDRDELTRAITDELRDADAVAHRIVHGGEHYVEPVLLTDEVVEDLRALTDLAPLHQPKSLAALDAVTRLLPDLPAVACFDTAFHATLSPAASTYAVPAEWRARWKVRKYGFHGLSHSWVARRAPQLLGAADENLRIISCHLGAGASLCAIAHGESIDTTMGFTPLDGLVMATRSGSVDPGMLLWLLAHDAVAQGEMASVLEQESGLLALAGSADMKEVLARANGDDADATLAINVYVHRLAGAIAAMAAASSGIDVLVFTGGVGERAPEIRARATAGLAFLGLAIHEGANQRLAGDGDISAARSEVPTLVIRAREDLEMARQAKSVLAT
jgi:acetate kinase